MSFQIGARLTAVAKFVRQGAYFADIGTDHAYLPLLLLKENKIQHAVCTDVNEGPLNTARTNAKAHGQEDKMSFYLTDGADGLESLPITDYAICGMGSDLMSDIISRAPAMKKQGVRLILQPMTKIATLRSFLAREGFATVTEGYVFEGRRYYFYMVAEYTGECRDLSYVDSELGEATPRVILNDAHKAFMKYKRHVVCSTMLGKRVGGEDYSKEEILLFEIDKLLKTVEDEDDC